MKIDQKQSRGYALLIALFFSALSLLALAGAAKWTSNTSKLTDRNNAYYKAAAAAEASTERVLANMSKDFQNGGEASVYSRLDTYRNMKPATDESGYWENYTFSDAQTRSGTYVNRLTAWSYVPIESQYAGLFGMASTYRVVSNARAAGFSPAIIGAVRQDVQVASIPIFQFAIFYAVDLEVNPGPNMNITGRVHSNAKIYNQPQATLNYLSHVTAADKIIIGKSPLDPTVRTPGTVNFVPPGEADSGVSAISLPIGTNNTPAAVRQVVEIPPAGESASSLLGQQRYYNKADMVIVVSNSTVTVKSGAWNNFATTVPYTNISSWVNTNVTFRNAREGKTVRATEIDVSKLIAWSATNAIIRTNLNRDISSLYVADMRTPSSNTTYEAGVRLVNGQVLPSQGLTVATPDPLYIKGHYNAPAAYLGTTNTTLTKPASLIGDAINILSTAWSDSNANSGLSSRIAANTTVNAAFLAGIVQSNGTYYSGGVENFPRFLEDWSNKSFTYNGSMVVMFPSQFATAGWGGSDVYSPPTRNWAFDLNFMDATKLPPGTPQVSALVRGTWAMIPPGTIQ
jgi:hypothetical protein